ncbi:hypothetical protein DSY4665 [Desulfitobacterium hafniense Y51]|uniref:Uncharacterized protein n=1 Tax=Desulfitobacterium hafniense (strain Y51) TaxID=138119 RepID=Q24ND8_DESHY|nr:hypothetical protein DSY4665 [Desulfitobacterium hafniense Y51]
MLLRFFQSRRICCHTLLKRFLFIQFIFPHSSLLPIGKGGRNAFQFFAPLDLVSLIVLFVKVIPILIKAVYSRHTFGHSIPVNKLILKKRAGIAHNSDQIQFQLYFFRVYHLLMGSKKHRWFMPVLSFP